MIGKIAWKNIIHKPLNTALCISLLMFGVGIITLLILIQHQLEEKFERDLRNTDLVIGAKGSPLQLVLSAIYHLDAPTGNISLAEAHKIMENPMVQEAIPLAYGDSYLGYRILGTTKDYIKKYNATFKKGKVFSQAMEATIGANVAVRTKLKVGDTFFGTHGEIKGGHVHENHPYTVVGILEKTNTVLDKLILCNIESVWQVHSDKDDHSHSTTNPGNKLDQAHLNDSGVEELDKHDHEEAHIHDAVEEHVHNTEGEHAHEQDDGDIHDHAHVHDKGEEHLHNTEGEHEHDEEHIHDHEEAHIHDTGEEHVHGTEGEHEHDDGDIHDHEEAHIHETGEEHVHNTEGDHAHEHEEGDIHDHEEAHIHDQDSEEITFNADSMDITAILLKYKSKMAMLSLPRQINEETNLMAALPAIEINRLFHMLGVGATTLKLIAGGIMIMASFSIFFVLYSRLRDRKYELALMRSVGYTPVSLFTLLMLEGLLLAIIGYGLGWLMSRLGLYIVNQQAQSDFNFQFSGGLFLDEVWLLLITFSLGLISALLPAWSAMRMDVARTLSDN